MKEINRRKEDKGEKKVHCKGDLRKSALCRQIEALYSRHLFFRSNRPPQRPCKLIMFSISSHDVSKYKAPNHYVENLVFWLVLCLFAEACPFCLIKRSLLEAFESI
ncbi:hypothetical protein Ancab_037483, partial [Ancistrocladus abbreviatus]